MYDLIYRAPEPFFPKRYEEIRHLCQDSWVVNLRQQEEPKMNAMDMLEKIVGKKGVCVDAEMKDLLKIYEENETETKSSLDYYMSTYASQAERFSKAYSTWTEARNKLENLQAKLKASDEDEDEGDDD